MEALDPSNRTIPARRVFHCVVSVGGQFLLIQIVRPHQLRRATPTQHPRNALLTALVLTHPHRWPITAYPLSRANIFSVSQNQHDSGPTVVTDML
jgi:hypothetical protein